MTAARRFLPFFAAGLVAFGAAADAVFPVPGWVDRPDPIASPFARTGGVIRLYGGPPPKSLNAYIDSNTYTYMTFQLMYETLLTVDPVTSEFAPGLACHWTISDDGHDFTFEIDPAAVWSDGRPVTAEDVRWTFDIVRDPASQTGPFQVMLADFAPPTIITNAAETVHRTVRFHVSHPGRHWRDLLNCGAQLQILPAHAFRGKRFTALDLVNAVVSGPYRLARVDPQVESVFARRPDWWRAARPSCRHTMNFDTITMRYYADAMNAFEAFKAGRLDVYAVYSARIWANETHGPKFDRNWILARRVRNHRPVGFQGFAFNMRRPPFDDLRVRQALAMLIDRATMNRTLMFSLYFLHRSYFEDLYDVVHPCPNRFWPYDPAAAARLLDAAGWTVDPATGLRTKDGRPFVFTFLSRDAMEDKFLAPFSATLRATGIEMKIVRKDFAGWMRDMDAFNFDMAWASWSSSVFRDPEPAWASSEADRPSGNNIPGLKIPALDALIAEEKSVLSAAARNDLYRRMDALIAAQVPYILLWNTDSTRLLYWNRFGTPPTILDRFDDETCLLTYWWFDSDSAAELDEAQHDGTVLPRVPVDVDYDTAFNSSSTKEN